MVGRVAEAKGIDVEEPAERGCLVFKAYGFARCGDPTIYLEPERFKVRSNLAHPPSHRVVQAGLALERWIHGQEAIIDRCALVVKKPFDRAKPFIDRGKKQPVLLFC